MLIHRLPPLSKNIATSIGLTAIIFWSSNVGLMREVSQHFGAIGGTALIYTVASCALLLTVGVPHLKAVSKHYLIGGSLLFICCELCFSLSIAFAHTARQAIEVSMVNYLWPTLTLACAVLCHHVKATWVMIPGCLLALVGIGFVVGGDEGLNFASMLINIQDNPLSYGLALSAAVLWAIYCTFTVKMSHGVNLVTFFFILVTVVLWAKYFMLQQPALSFDFSSTLLLILAGCGLGLGYGAWNIGMISGNVTLMVGASYFTPVLSAFFASLILGTALSTFFWQGVIMVTSGAILCWLATLRRAKI